MKKDYWKIEGCDEGTILFERREDALENSAECRKNGEKAYVRKIRMTEDEFNNSPEL